MSRYDNDPIPTDDERYRLLHNVANGLQRTFDMFPPSLQPPDGWRNFYIARYTEFSNGYTEAFRAHRYPLPVKSQTELIEYADNVPTYIQYGRKPRIVLKGELFADKKAAPRLFMLMAQQAARLIPPTIEDRLPSQIAVSRAEQLQNLFRRQFDPEGL